MDDRGDCRRDTLGSDGFDDRRDYRKELVGSNVFDRVSRQDEFTADDYKSVGRQVETKNKGGRNDTHMSELQTIRESTSPSTNKQRLNGNFS